MSSGAEESAERERNANGGVTLPGGLAVLNPGGSDPDQQFADGAGSPADPRPHAPINYHAYAACTSGSFNRSLKSLRVEQNAVLLLIRRDLKLVLKTLIALQAAGKRVAVSLKEAGPHQVAALLDDAKRIGLFREICSRADFCLSSTQDLIPFYIGAGARRTEFVPTPYPVDLSAWDFSRPTSNRRGIMIGTREFNVPTRNHLGALMAVRSLGEPITVVNADGRQGRKRLAALGIPELRVVEGRLAYPAYLELMAGHRLVFQLDRSSVPGQVAGDALLCRIPCVGGDGSVERIAFPALSGFGADTPTLVARVRTLMSDDAFYEAAVSESQRLAGEKLSFATGAARLGEVFA